MTCPGSGAAVYPDPEDDGHRCGLARQFAIRDVVLAGETGGKIAGEFARRYATQLELTGTADLPVASIRFLLEELPDTARLINHYEGTRYEIKYLDGARERFFATNNRNMSATFSRFRTLVSNGTSRYLLFESGEAKFLFWHFKGSAIIELDLMASGDETDYAARMHIFTDLKRYRSFFRSGIFRYVIKSVVTRIIGNLVSAANSLIDSNENVASLSMEFVRTLRSTSN